MSIEVRLDGSSQLLAAGQAVLAIGAGVDRAVLGRLVGAFLRPALVENPSPASAIADASDDALESERLVERGTRLACAWGMDAIQLSGGPPRAFLVVFRTGDEAASGLLELAQRQRLESARLGGIGGFSRVTLGYFDCEKKAYERIDVPEQVEVVSLIGNLTTYDGAPRLHAHVMVTRSDGTARGGHLLEGHVRPTLEITVDELPIRVHRSFDAASGIPLIDVGASRRS